MMEPMNTAERHAERGCALCDEGRLDEAIVEFRLAVALQPDDADLRFDLGRLLDVVGRLEEAAEEYQAAIGLRVRVGAGGLLVS